MMQRTQTREMDMAGDNLRAQGNTKQGWSLRGRLTFLIIITVFLGTGIGIYLDYRREYSVHTDELFDSLLDEAKALSLSRTYISDPVQFTAYADRLCSQINESVSPGHHILILNPDGSVLVDAVHHSGDEATGSLLATTEPRSIVPVGGRQLVQVRLKDPDGSTIIVAQYLDVIHQILRAQLINRAVTLGIVAVALAVLITLLINGWVMNPVARLMSAATAWTARNFAARSEVTGPPDLRVLADAFNAMASGLEHVERNRQAELDRARQIQSNLLPSSIFPIPGISLTALFRPAASVAGDLYDVFPLPDGRAAIFILDVAGHGFSAALLTGVVQMSVQRRLTEFDNLSQTARAVNHDLLKCSAQGAFVTLCVGIWKPSERTWTYCGASHAGGVLIQGGKLTPLPSTGPLLGIMADAEWTQTEMKLHDGDRVILFTDGVTDAGEPSDPLGSQGLEQLLSESSYLPLDGQMRLVANKALRRCGDSYCDDVTMVGFEVLPEGRKGQHEII